MIFEGVVEAFSAGRISGWIRCTPDARAETEDVRVHLQFRTMGKLLPDKIIPRPGGRIGFIFNLPVKFQEMPWTQFLEEFDSVIATHVDAPTERWRVPLYKSVMGAFDANNRTAVLAERPREYAVKPRPGGRLAALTIVYNEHLILPLWAKYYSSIVGAENVFILDQGSDRPYQDLPDGVAVIRLPRDNFDNWLIMRLVATFQRHLLESYDAVLYSDSDEFLCVSPEALDGVSLKEFLLNLETPVGITRGYNLHHDILREPALDDARPVLEQRMYLTRERAMDKPMISRVPLNWTPGFHTAREGGVAVPGMMMLHLRWYDLDAALKKGGRYRGSKWDPLDVEQNLAGYQRASDDDIVLQFRKRALQFREISSSEFDPSAEITVLEPWMRQAVWV